MLDVDDRAQVRLSTPIAPRLPLIPFAPRGVVSIRNFAERDTPKCSDEINIFFGKWVRRNGMHRSTVIFPFTPRGESPRRRGAPDELSIQQNASTANSL